MYTDARSVNLRSGTTESKRMTGLAGNASPYLCGGERNYEIKKFGSVTSGKGSRKGVA